MRLYQGISPDSAVKYTATIIFLIVLSVFRILGVLFQKLDQLLNLQLLLNKLQGPASVKYFNFNQI